ncbi:type II toxin-antitoxin system VapC family toxin [Siculibacillus lacustris]|uniref:type II toxin-antitoxin system VapC family toxin n=1 Tax=Siculibacillus lacustris TaxID=1549641 RepID=UPI0019D2FD65|nr:PIN domain-containing protein [Siculibacillus lacustris]
MTPPLAYLDTNIFISAFEGPGAVSDHAWWLLDAIEAGRFVGVTSELTLAEVLVHPLRHQDEALTEAYAAMLTTSPVFAVMPVDRSILVSAARLRARFGALRLPDAIHLATALAAEASHFVSRDVRLGTICPIRFVDGGPHSLDQILEASL